MLHGLPDMFTLSSRVWAFPVNHLHTLFCYVTLCEIWVLWTNKVISGYSRNRELSVWCWGHFLLLDFLSALLVALWKFCILTCPSLITLTSTVWTNYKIHVFYCSKVWGCLNILSVCICMYVCVNITVLSGSLFKKL